MFKKLSLRTKLLAIICTVSIVALSLFGVMANQSTKSLKNGKEVQVKAAVESLLDKIDRNLFERYGDVQAFALSEPARSGNPTRIIDFMNDMMGTYAPVYDLMMVTNARGKVVAVNGVDKTGKNIDTAFILGKDFSTEPWFKAAISGEIKEATSFVEDLHVDNDVARVTNGSGRVMNFTAPIRDKKTKEILGIWTNRMSWSDVVEAIIKEESTKLKSDRIKQTFSYLLDKKGIFIMHPQGSEFELKKTKDDFESLKSSSKGGSIVLNQDLQAPFFKGEVIEVLTPSKGYSTYPSQGWYGIIQVPTHDDQIAFNTKLIGIAIFLMCLGVFVSFWFVRGLAKVFDKITIQLRGEANQVKNAASSINSASQNLAQSATQQASALQETAASIEEMNAMVKKSSENANKSREVANTSHEVATKGKQAVEQMVQAINEIDESNVHIMKQVEESNRQISEIVKVITEIGNKTKVINDIVFQTKLLSFNASVEAARAGEHGKGFAVVAEEVGNLAQMSGNAAKEISDMLNGSIQKVESIVNDTKVKVERLISEGKTKVETGTIVSKQCGEILEEVVKNVAEVNTMISEISTASHEQAQGISEITKAMNQMDQVTHENAATSQQSASSSAQLSAQSESLLKVVMVLEETIGGKAGSKPYSQDQEPPAPLSGIDFSSQSKIVALDSARKHESSHSSTLKKAAGSDFIPSENDPRFKEI